MTKTFAVRAAALGAIGALSLALAVVACTGEDPDIDAPNNGGDSGSDTSASSRDGANPDGSTDPGDGGTEPPAVFSPFTPASWTAYDVKAVASAAGGFQGATYAGRYVYFAPENSGVITRYDTQGAFDVTTAWETYDVVPTVTATPGYAGAIAVGGFVYFVPYAFNNGGHTWLVRYDEKKPFTNADAWTSFDINTAIGAGLGFFGAVTDGKYIYFVPGQNTARSARYDTTKPLAEAASWTSYNAADAGAPAGYAGGAFDGRYVYFAPSRASEGNSHAARHDTKSAAPFESGASWSKFDFGTINGAKTGYRGAVFDGRYVYFVPNVNGVGITTHGVVVRFDTTGQFNESASWRSFDLATPFPQATGFRGGAFDGRYLYLVPHGSGNGSTLVRHDTTLDFGSSASWASLDLTTVHPNARGFQGAAFDGTNLYLVPFLTTGANTLALRFSARTPPFRPALAPSFF